MTSSDFVLFAIQITIMLTCSIIFGEAMRRIGQPAVLGEMLGGILLGPTLFGALAPTLYADLFVSAANVTAVREATTKLGMLFFLFMAGLEVNISDIRRIGQRAISIGLVGTLLPILVGIALAYLLPLEFLGATTVEYRFTFALFLGMNLANSANPVIARILLDLGLLKHEIGTLIMTATLFDDLINWALFAFILNNLSATTNAAVSTPFGLSVILVFVFFAVILGGGRWLAPRALPWIKQHLAWPSGFIAVTALIILLVSSLAEYLGIHAFLGAFLVGAAFSDDRDEEAYRAVSHFALSFFAPLYFVSMGMTVNFAAHFDLLLVLVLIVIACISKIGAVLLGARLAGMPVSRETLAIGFGLNARGATGIILAGVGLEHQLIDERFFVALVFMALVTSLISGPAIKYLLLGRETKAFWFFRETAE